MLDLRKNTGKEENRARDLFYGLWIPDLFMKRVQEDGDWSLMCPSECPGEREREGGERERERQKERKRERERERERIIK